MRRFLDAQASAQTTTDAYVAVAESVVRLAPDEGAIIRFKNTGANAVHVKPQFRYSTATTTSAWVDCADTAVSVASGDEVVFDSRTWAPLGTFFQLLVKSAGAGNATTVTVYGIVDTAANLAAVTITALSPSGYEVDNAATISGLATLLGKFDSGLTPAGTEADDLSTANSEADDAVTELATLLGVLDSGASADGEIGADIGYADAAADAAKAALDNATGSSAAVKQNALVVQAMVGDYTAITAGPEDTNAAPVEFTVVDSAGSAVNETKTFLFALLDSSDSSIFAQSAFTLSASTGSVTALSASLALYQVVTDATGVFEGTVTDVVGGSGKTVVFYTAVRDGNTVYLESPPTISNITFD